VKTTRLHSSRASDDSSLICVRTGSQCLVFIPYLFVHGQVHSTDKFFGAKGPGVEYDLSEGHALCSRILAKYLPYEPHDYQLDGICPVMVGFDLLVTTPTGSGNTGYLIMLMLVVREISADATLTLGEGECIPVFWMVVPL
jgi:hypothetical protein